MTRKLWNKQTKSGRGLLTNGGWNELQIKERMPNKQFNSSVKFDVSFYWFSSCEFCHISDNRAMSGKTNGRAKQNWFRYFSTKPFTAGNTTKSTSQCYSQVALNICVRMNIWQARRNHIPLTHATLEFVALPNLPYCIFILYFCHLTGRIQHYLMTCSISCLEGVMRFDVTRAVWIFHTNPVLAFILKGKARQVYLYSTFHTQR